MKKYLKFTWIVLAAIALASCDSDYLTVESTASLTADKYREIISSDPEALQQSVSALYFYLADYSYSSYSSHDDCGIGAVLHAGDMMTEDIVQVESHWFTYDYALDFRMNNYRRPYGTWKLFYTLINQANDIITLVDMDRVNSDANDATTKSLRGFYGESLALRAYCNFMLVQIFQNAVTAAPDASGAHIDRTKKAVPLFFSTNEAGYENDYTRGNVGNVLDAVERDLLKAEQLLNGYARPTKVEIDQSVVRGLLARYYLFVGNWDKAIQYAQLAREKYTLMDQEELMSGFLDIESKEWMWGYDFTTETSTVYASWYSHLSNIAQGYAGIGYAPRAIDKRLYESIEATDYRKAWFNDEKGDKDNASAGAQVAYANLKFGDDGNWTMDNVYMRAAEMYLIEAEALAQKGDNAGAATALKPLMEARCSEWSATSLTVDDVVLQRRIELWGEGHGLFDLKRLYRGIDRTYEGSNHRKPDGWLKVDAGAVEWTYQIPLKEIQENSYITEADQNP